MTARIKKIRPRMVGKRAVLSMGVDRLRKMFLRECAELNSNRDIEGKIPTDVLIGIKFRDGSFHGVYPAEDETAWIMNELIDQNPDLFNDVEVVGDEEELTVPNRIIFRNRQAIGDILMFTCAVRDFKKYYPNVEVKVESTAMHIWDHNPYISGENFVEVIDPKGHAKGDVTPQQHKEAIRKAIDEDRPVRLYVGSGRGTNQSNFSDLHFANAYRLSIEDTLGISIPQGPIWPDVYLSEAEKSNKIFEFPYWIITAGEKGDWTAKTWPVMWWQAVVDALPEITFVQIGQRKREHRKLEGNNVIDYRGKTEDKDTGIRDLLRLFYHCEGSIGLVSFHMHLAAAFNKPCVVIAGAREPQHFTHYPSHRYLSTDGCLPCTVKGGKPRACWYCDVDRCEFPVDIRDQKVPKCVAMITPGEVVRNINMYYEGGRLNVEVENKKCKPPLVVADKQSSPSPIESELKSNVDTLVEESGFEWGGTSITRADWDFMAGILGRYNVKRVVEFGCGLSSLLFADFDYGMIKVTSYEFDRYPGDWIDKINGLNSEIDIREWDGESEVNREEYDLVFVDGPFGSRRREVSISQAAGLADLVIVHDAGRILEREYQEKYLSPNFEQMDKGGTRCAFWKRVSKTSTTNSIQTSTVTVPSKGTIKFIFNGRGEGGAERSTTWLMNTFHDKGYDVNYISPKGPSGTFKKLGNKNIEVLDFQDDFYHGGRCDLLVLYVNDWVWEFRNDRVAEIFESVRPDKKVMIVNYRLGEIGRVGWTTGWDKYIFLNSSLEGELKKRLGIKGFDVSTKILPPPTDLKEFLKIEPNYEGALRIVRHSSQGDAKYPKDFGLRCADILGINPELTISLMPAPSFFTRLELNEVISHKRNQPPVPEFLAGGNCFWYWLPEGYHDQGPKVIMEAQATGLPVIAQNHSGPKDRVVDGTGFLSDDFKDHLEFISALSSSVDLRREVGQKARQHAALAYDPERWIDEILG